MNLENNKSKNSKFITDAVFIAFCTFIGYAISVSYQIGFNSYFGIPRYLVSVDVTNVLLFGVYTIIGLNFFWLISDFLIKFLIRRSHSYFGLSVGIYIFGVIIMIFYWIYIYPPSLSEFFLPLVAVVFIGLNEFAKPLLLSNKKTYKEKYEYQRELEKKENEDSIFSIVITNIKDVYLLVFVLSIFVLFVAHITGVRNAKNSTVFELVSYPENSVILGIYKNFLVTSSYNPKTRILENKIHLISLDDFSKDNYSLTSTTTGKLIPKN